MRRNKWSKESDYIINLTKQLVNNDALASIADEVKEANGGCSPNRVHSYVSAMIMNRIKKMNDATLGRICAYATANGAHYGQDSSKVVRPKFINRTGLANVFGDSAKHVITTRVGVGEFLEYMTTAVITCVVVDLIQQERWIAEWENPAGVH